MQAPVITNVFTTYMTATQNLQRSVKINDKDHRYPEKTVEMDLHVFSGLFCQLWETRYKNRQAAHHSFKALFEMKDSPLRTLIGCIWAGSFFCNSRLYIKEEVLADEDLAYEFCRTLRNGFNHFNFSYCNKSTQDYFNEIGITKPTEFPDKFADNYRVYIYDHTGNWLDQHSNSRAIEVQYHELRYSMHLFLRELLTPNAPRVNVFNQRIQ